MILSKFFVVIEVRPCHYIRGGSRGRVQGVRTPPPPPWDDLRFSNTTGILQKKMWVIGVEVEQEMGAPPPKKILDPPLYIIVSLLFTAFIGYEMKRKINSGSLVIGWLNNLSGTV